MKKFSIIFYSPSPEYHVIYHVDGWQESAEARQSVGGLGYGEFCATCPPTCPSKFEERSRKFNVGWIQRPLGRWALHFLVGVNSGHICAMQKTAPVIAAVACPEYLVQFTQDHKDMLGEELVKLLEFPYAKLANLVETVTTLIRQGANVNYYSAKHDLTPLHAVIKPPVIPFYSNEQHMKDRMMIAQLLVAQGARETNPDSCGHTVNWFLEKWEKDNNYWNDWVVGFHHYLRNTKNK